MNDLEKMRQEFDKKMQYAQMENQVNEVLKNDGIEISIIGKSCSHKGLLHVSIHATKGNYGFTEFRLTPLQVGAAMINFPVTQKTDINCVDGKLGEVDYKMVVHRYLHEHRTELSIDWISGEYDISVDMYIDDFVDDADFMQFFKIGCRDVDREWTGARTRWNYNARHYFRYYTFNGGRITKFQGGRDYQMSDSYANSIAEMFKYRYQFEPTE
jgi:hypothetical protein